MIAAVSLGLRAFRDFTAFERRRTDRVTITRMYAAVRNYIDREGIRRPLITTDSETWSYTAGVLLRLRQDGTSLAVADDWLPMFTRALTPRGDEDAVISMVRASTPEALRNGSANQLQLDSAGRRVYASRLTPPR